MIKTSKAKKNCLNVKAEVSLLYLVIEWSGLQENSFRIMLVMELDSRVREKLTRKLSKVQKSPHNKEIKKVGKSNSS